MKNKYCKILAKYPDENVLGQTELVDVLMYTTNTEKKDVLKIL